MSNARGKILDKAEKYAIGYTGKNKWKQLHHLDKEYLIAAMLYAIRRASVKKNLPVAKAGKAVDGYVDAVEWGLYKHNNPYLTVSMSGGVDGDPVTVTRRKVEE